MTISGNFEIFNSWTLKQIFWKTKIFFKKLGYRFVVQSYKIENATFPYKTTLSEANVKTNRIGITKWTYCKERNFANDDFNFLIFFFSLKTPCKELIWFHIHTFRKRWSFIWGCFFSVGILNFTYFTFFFLTFLLLELNMYLFMCLFAGIDHEIWWPVFYFPWSPASRELKPRKKRKIKFEGVIFPLICIASRVEKTFPLFKFNEYRETG